MNLRSVVAYVALGIACGSASADQRIVCPSAVVSDQIKVQGPAGWTGAYVPDIQLKLVSAGVQLGPLEVAGVLKPEITRKGDAAEHRFSLTGGVSDQLDKWVVCTYQSNVYLAQKLPPATKECTVIYQRASGSTANPPNVTPLISCK